MPSRQKRYQTFDQHHFITFTCYHQLSFLDNGDARNSFEEIVRQHHAFAIYG